MCRLSYRNILFQRACRQRVHLKSKRIEEKEKNGFLKVVFLHFLAIQDVEGMPEWPPNTNFMRKKKTNTSKIKQKNPTHSKEKPGKKGTAL